MLFGGDRLADAAAGATSGTGEVMSLLTEDSIGAARDSTSRFAGVHRTHAAA